MQHALRVRVGEPGDDLLAELEREPGRRVLLLEEGVERHPVEQLHHQERPLRRHAEVDDADDVRVLQPAQRAPLALKALARLRVRAVLGVQHLQRDVRPAARALGAIDRPRAARAELREHAIATIDDLPDEIRCHGGAGLYSAPGALRGPPARRFFR